jgi:hypothetical protein
MKAAASTSTNGNGNGNGNDEDESAEEDAGGRGAAVETSAATTTTRELLRRLEESERVRDGLREALMTLKSRYESLELACGGAEALGRRGRSATALAANKESALERRTASEERLRRMRAEAEVERLKRATADVMRERAEREAEVSARLASGGLPGTSRVADANENAASAKELKTLRATCERQKRQIKELRDEIKALKVAGNGRSTDDVDALLPSSPARKTKKASSTAATAKTRTMPVTTNRRVKTKHATTATTPTPPSSLPDAGAESAEPPLPGADEQWTRRPPTLLAPLAPPRPPSSTVPPTTDRPTPPPTTSHKRPASTHKRTGALQKLQKQTERTKRAFRLPK